MQWNPDFWHGITLGKAIWFELSVGLIKNIGGKTTVFDLVKGSWFASSNHREFRKTEDSTGNRNSTAGHFPL